MATGERCARRAGHRTPECNGPAAVERERERQREYRRERDDRDRDAEQLARDVGAWVQQHRKKAR
jgi:hypothetical protein